MGSDKHAGQNQAVKWGALNDWKETKQPNGPSQTGKPFESVYDDWHPRLAN